MKRNVLIVSNNALSLTQNNGKTLNSFFENYELGSVSQLYFNDDSPETNLDANFYKLYGYEQFISRFRFEKFSAGERVKLMKSGPSNSNVSMSGKRRVVEFINNHLDALKLILRDWSYLPGIYKNARLFQWISDINANCMFFMCGNNFFAIQLVLFISKKFSIPIIVYITDDYVLLNKSAGPFGKYYFDKLNDAYEKVFERSSQNYFIGERMLEAFQEKYNVDGDVLINCNLIHESITDKKLKVSLTNKRINFIYAGGLHLGRLKSLIELSVILDNVFKNIDMTFGIDLYTTTYVDKNQIESFKRNSIIYQGALGWNELKNKLVSANFLLHIESFMPEYISKTRFSVSTKLPEYLSSGTCVLGFGPEELASMKLLSEHEIGVCIDPNNVESIQKLREVLVNVELKSLIESAAKDYSNTNFSPDKLRLEFFKKINEV